MRKKKLVFVVPLLIIVILVAVYFLGVFNSDEYSLKQKGYTSNEAKLIVSKITDIKNISDKPYNSFLAKNISNKDFNYKLLDRYTAYKEKNAIDDNEVLELVNNDIDKLNINYDNNIILFINNDYYKKDNLDRYLEYKKKNDLEIKEIVKRVNSNIDREFYTGTENSDFTKDNRIIANKYYYLDKYIPTNLVSIDSQYGGGTMDLEAYQAFIEMYNEIEKQGLGIRINSAYRSFDTQKQIYNNYVNKNGFEWAEKWSARPGYSEHQTGLAVDVTVKDRSSFDGFENSKEYEWMKDNCYRFGFILRYTEENKYITGYNFEPWHYRYVGKDIAKTIAQKNLTYEEYYEYYVK